MYETIIKIMYNISEEEFEKALETILQSMKSPKKREFVLYSFNKNFIKKFLEFYPASVLNLVFFLFLIKHLPRCPLKRIFNIHPTIKNM